jgi:hypothetical protein
MKNSHLLGAVCATVLIFITAQVNTAPSAKKSLFVPPAWSSILSPAARFVLALNDEAVLDKETGLVWEKSPVETHMTWYVAVEYCTKKELGGRLGWRLPTVEELASLIDSSQSDPALPPGNPFVNVQDFYYTMTTYLDGGSVISNYAYAVGFRGEGNIGPSIPPGKNIMLNVWCVRGGHGYDGFQSL